MRKDVIELGCAKYTSENSEELLPGSEYIVYGQCLVADCLLYLIDPIREGLSRPFWYPASMFSVCNAKLSCEWHFVLYPRGNFSGDVKAVWGYEQLANSSEHFIGLMERDPKALEIFVRYKDMLH